MSFESQDADVYPGDDERKRDSSRKRDGKKEKKEKGYQMFEEEDSEEERLVLAEEIKSPSKTKKERIKPSFKFPVAVRKEKTKEKEEKKDKESKEEKEKKKEEKKKNKTKEKKKLKTVHSDPANIIAEASVNENPIFGVPLATAVERNKSHDGIELPAIVRECIDYIEECGLACEGIYRISGVKSKVQHLKDCYNRQQTVHLFEHEPNIVASLLKQFLRDLPEPVLTTALMPKFEEASTIKNSKKKVEAFSKLIMDLPTCNRLLLSWMIVHMTHVIELAKENKMTLQNVSIVLSPTMQISHRVLNILFSHVHELFGDVLLRKYVPPLKPAHSKWSLELPDNPSALEEELAKQESLLNQLHAEVNSGREDPVIVDQLWEVQRVVTQLKRKIKTAKKNVEMGERRRTNLDAKRSSTASIPSLSAPEDLHLDLRPAPEPVATNVTTVVAVVEKQPEEETQSRTEPVAEVKKGVKFAESSKKTRAPQIGDIKKMEDDKKEKEAEENVAKGLDEDNKVGVVEGTVVEEKDETKANGSDEKPEKVEEQKCAVDAPVAVEESQVREAGANLKEEDRPECEKVRAVSAELKSGEDVEVSKVVKETIAEKSSNEIVVKPADAENTKKEEPVKAEEAKLDEKSKTVSRFSVEMVPDKSIPVPQGKPAEPAEESVAVPISNVSQTAKVEQVKPETKPQQVDAPPQQVDAPPQQVVAPPQQVDAPPQPKKVEYVYRKPPNPPFMSTALLQPMKAEIPKPKKPAEETDAKKEHIRISEELRELEEELLGEKKRVSPKNEDDEEYDIPEDVDIEQLLDEEYALKLEEEELLAIADELRQKIATERSEMERLTQEIQELQYLRQDSDLEDLSTSSSSSDESEDEDDLQELLTQLIQDNEHLEMKNADLCQKIHEERMICLSVKLQIRLLQQKHLETSYG